MTAIISATDNEFYSFPLPITIWTWNKLGINVIVFTPELYSKKIELAKKYCNNNTKFFTFKCEQRKEATYSQTSRLFGATVVNDDNELLITGDADLAVFGQEFSRLNKEEITIIGGDLLDASMKQYPMCFIAMNAKKWREVFELKNKTLQEALDETVGQLQSINFRGDFWGYDQWLAYDKIQKNNKPITIIKRAKYPEMFATRRCDRDNHFWRLDLSDDLIDAHLWRPGYTDENFANIIELMTTMYPYENFDWLINYNEEYKQLL